MRIGLLLVFLILMFLPCAPATAQEQELQSITDAITRIPALSNQLTTKQAEYDRLAQLGDPFLPGAKARREKMEALAKEITALRSQLASAQNAYNSALDGYRKATASVDALRKRAIEVRGFVLATAKDESNKWRAVDAIDRDLEALAPPDVSHLVTALDSVLQGLRYSRPIDLLVNELEDRAKAVPSVKGLTSQLIDVLKELATLPLPDRAKAFIDRYGQLGKLEKLIALARSGLGSNQDPFQSQSMGSLISFVDFMKELTPAELNPTKGYTTFVLAQMESINRGIKKLKMLEAGKNLSQLEIVAGYDHAITKSEQPYPNELFGKFDSLEIDGCLVGHWIARSSPQFAGYAVRFEGNGAQTVDYSQSQVLQLSDKESITWRGMGKSKIATSNQVASVKEQLPGSVTMTLITPAAPVPVEMKWPMGFAGLGNTTGTNKYVCTVESLSYDGSTHIDRHPNFAVTLARLK
jgi:hypothetical protein